MFALDSGAAYSGLSMLSFALTLLAGLVCDVPTPQLEPAAIQHRFGTRPRATSEAALEVLAPRSPTARIWLGNLALEDGDLPRALRQFAASTEGPEASLAHRGLGDVSAARHHWGTAAAEYERALPGATAPVAYELGAKAAAARREQRWQRLELGCWLTYLAAAGWLALRLRAAPLGWPLELTFLVPVYATFLAVSWTHGKAVVLAITWIACGSLAAVALLFAGPPRHRLFAGLLALVMHAALIYVALHRSGLLAGRDPG